MGSNQILMFQSGFEWVYRYLTDVVVRVLLGYYVSTFAELCARSSTLLWHAAVQAPWEVGPFRDRRDVGPLLEDALLLVWSYCIFADRKQQPPGG